MKYWVRLYCDQEAILEVEGREGMTDAELESFALEQLSDSGGLEWQTITTSTTSSTSSIEYGKHFGP